MVAVVNLDEHDVSWLEDLAYSLMEAGDIRASKLLMIVATCRAQEFHCNVDESAGLAELYELDPHSRKVSA